MPPLPVPSAYSARPHQWVKPEHPLTCPQVFGTETHKLKTNAAILGVGLLRCQHRPAAGQGECGTWVFVYRQPSGWHYVATVTPHEALFIRHRNMNDVEVLAFLGDAGPPPTPPGE